MAIALSRCVFDFKPKANWKKYLTWGKIFFILLRNLIDNAGVFELTAFLPFLLWVQKSFVLFDIWRQIRIIYYLVSFRIHTKQLRLLLFCLIYWWQYRHIRIDGMPAFFLRIRKRFGLSIVFSFGLLTPFNWCVAPNSNRSLSRPFSYAYDKGIESKLGFLMFR